MAWKNGCAFPNNTRRFPLSKCTSLLQRAACTWISICHIGVVMLHTHLHVWTQCEGTYLSSVSTASERALLSISLASPAFRYATSSITAKKSVKCWQWQTHRQTCPNVIFPTQSTQRPARNRTRPSAANNRLSHSTSHAWAISSFQLYPEMQLLPHGEQPVCVRKTNNLVLLTEVRVFAVQRVGIG